MSLRRRGKQGNVIRIGPRPELFDDFSYDECLSERRYNEGEIDRADRAIDAVAALDRRGAVTPEIKQIIKGLEEYLEACGRLIDLAEKRMIALSKKE